jgi:tRNA-2-methylthio-N6-dimethylallyladenosine synthase
MKKLHIKTYGCQMNEYDSAKIVALLKSSHGFLETDDANEANLILLNTCSIREKAEEKLFSDLGRFRKLKAKNPFLVIGVGGCVAVQEKEKITKRAPCVDIVFGPQTLHHLPKFYDASLKRISKIIDVSSAKSALEKFAYFLKPHAKGPIAFVSIMEGCNKFCSYCIVPYTRGREISRPFEDVIKEVEILAAQNVKEINLLGQNVNDYLAKDQNGKLTNLTDLIARIAKIDNILRIRFTTSHPSAFSEDLIEVFASERKLVNHLHLPVQSGSNKILAAMRRGYTTEEYKEKISKLRKVRPNISITTDFIVGFPNETEEDFAQTMNLINALKFDKSFSFIYSPRPFTKAAMMQDDVNLETKKERLKILQEQINKYGMEISESMVGSLQNVIVTHFAKHKNQLSSRTENNRTTFFTGGIDLIGQAVDVKITNALPNYLLATLSPN